MALIFGTKFNDILVGTNSDDTILDMDGNDTMTPDPSVCVNTVPDPNKPGSSVNGLDPDTPVMCDPATLLCVHCRRRRQ